jgi:uncharacterized membrane protein
MANRSKQRAQRRNRIIMTIFALLLVLSMMLSLVASLTGPVVTQPQVTAAPPPIVLTVAP